MSDEHIEPEAHETDSGRELQAANTFDLRRILGGLFLLYGVILVIVGLTDGKAEIDKAGGVHINLLTGIGMLVLGGLFVAWGLWRPLGEQLTEAEAEQPAE